MSRGRVCLWLTIGFGVALGSPHPARAVMDINDRGPMLRAGDFSMRVSNVGVLGNPFIDDSRSFDASFEYPSGSGVELMREVDLWIGGIGVDGRPHVSGAPRLELRPTLDPADRVLERFHGLPGTQALVDDDGDGRVDEEILNGKDDDGDGEIDEDLAISAQQELDADYVDDRPEAVQYVYPGGEPHTPLGVSVHQKVMAWSTPGYRSLAGLEYVITNHGDRSIKGLYLGLLADLDVRLANDPTGHLNDRLREIPWSFDRPEPPFFVKMGANREVGGRCMTHREGTVLAAVDGLAPEQTASIALVGLSHTIDPLEEIKPGLGRAPGKISFRYEAFANGAPPGEGGLPAVDEDRYAALAGKFPTRDSDAPADVVVLMSCGPFPTLAPGQSIEFRAALVAASVPDSLPIMLNRVASLHEGTFLNLEPDSTGPDSVQWDVGRSGLNGHEACIEPPPGIAFDFDPNCPEQYAVFDEESAPPKSVHYAHGYCVWTDADCDVCTGQDGRETLVHWKDPGSMPIAPRQIDTPGDHVVTVKWDNLPEILVAQGLSGTPGCQFLGYRIYKLADWSDRTSALPRASRWSLVAGFGDDTTASARPLAEALDTTVDYEKILYEKKLYPPGRYVFRDHDVLDGFRYAYQVVAVTTRPVRQGTYVFSVEDESPVTAQYVDTVVPHAAATDRAGGVWVVPNPYRGSASWELPKVTGDALTRHLDFMGLPRAPCRIKIWSVAGDLVAQIDHDGSHGDGQAAWNLVTRNGQDVVSGIYVFTVDSSAGRQTGRFVVIR